MNQEVLSTCFAGCGVDLSTVDQDSRFQEILFAEQALCDTGASSPALRALHHGELRALSDAHRGSRHRSATGLSVPAPPRERALIRFLGEKIISASVGNLPEEVKTLARNWTTASAEEQVQISLKLKHIFTSPGADSSWDTIIDQPNDRVLPALSGPWNTGSRHNCLGIAQLLAAFAEIAGAQSALVIPLEISSHRHSRILSESAAHSMFALRQLKLDPDDYFQLFLGEVARWGENRGGLPEQTHFALALRLKRGGWIVVDPNFRRVYQLSSESPVTRKIRKVRSLNAFAPGLALYAKSFHFEREMEKALALHGQYEAWAEEWIEAVDKAAYCYWRSAEILAQSSFFDHVLTYMDLPLGLKTAYTPVGAARLVLALKARISQADNRTLFESVEAWGSAPGVNEPLSRIASSSDIKRGIQAVALALFWKGFAALEKVWENAGKYLPDTHVEVGNTAFSLACATLAHVAANLGVWTKFEAELSRHCFSSHRLHNLALGMLSNGDSPAKPAKEDIVAALKKLPYLPPGTEYILHAVESGQTLEQANGPIWKQVEAVEGPQIECQGGTFHSITFKL